MNAALERMSAQLIRDTLAMHKAFKTEDHPDVPVLRARLKLLNAEAKERRDARKAILAGILSATHVRLKDGWVEVVRVDAPRHEVIVANGENREERIALGKILEVKAL